MNMSISVVGWSMVMMLLVSTCTSRNNHDGHHHKSQQKAGEEYTCPMHPQIVQNEPGTCPICGMDLVKKEVDGKMLEMTDALDYMLQPTNTTVVSSIRTVRAEQKTQVVTVQANGVITYDTRQAYTIPARFGGRIEKLFIRYNFQSVKKGQKIMELYSPELISAQKELLFLLQTDADNDALVELAKQKLRLLGVTDRQIDQVVQSGKEQYSLAIYSPYGGYVVASKPASEPASTSINPSKNTGLAMPSGGMGNMNSTSNATGSSMEFPPADTEISWREGMYVDKGQSLFKIVNIERVWAEFNLYADDAATIQVGDTIEIGWGNSSEQNIQAKVDFIQPFFNEGESFKKVRVYLQNQPYAFRVGQLISARFKSKAKNGYWIPASSVLDLGLRKLVFVKDQKTFRPTEVKTGRKAGNQIELLAGIGPQAEIAYNAQFLVDSESFVRTDIGNLKNETE